MKCSASGCRIENPAPILPHATSKDYCTEKAFQKHSRHRGCINREHEASVSPWHSSQNWCWDLCGFMIPHRSAVRLFIFWSDLFSRSCGVFSLEKCWAFDMRSVLSAIVWRNNSSCHRGSPHRSRISSRIRAQICVYDQREDQRLLNVPIRHRRSGKSLGFNSDTGIWKPIPLEHPDNFLHHF